jgi:regulator of replication initiation timing
MNQIMINAVELQLIEDEVKALRLEKEELKRKLAEAQEKIKILKEEVQWALNGYIRK